MFKGLKWNSREGHCLVKKDILVIKIDEKTPPPCHHSRRYIRSLSFWHSNNVKCLFFLLIDDWICCEISLFHAVRCACVRKSKDIKKSIFPVYFKGGLIQKFDLRLWIFSDTFSINSWWSHFCDFTSENCLAKMGLNDR